MAKKTIKLKKYQDIINEYFAEAVLSPGNLLKVTGTGGVVKNTVAAKRPSLVVALEDELQGKTINDDYADASPVQCWMLQPGEEVLLRGVGAIALGAEVETDATGGVVTLAAGVAIGVCLEAIAATGFVKVRIL
jgi:hypothetical protein